MICPSCKKRLMEPESEVSICVLCGSIAMVQDGKLRPPTPSERAQVQESNDYLMAMAVVQGFDTPVGVE